MQTSNFRRIASTSGSLMSMKLPFVFGKNWRTSVRCWVDTELDTSLWNRQEVPRRKERTHIEPQQDVYYAEPELLCDRLVLVSQGYRHSYAWKKFWQRCSFIRLHLLHKFGNQCNSPEIDGCSVIQNRKSTSSGEESRNTAPPVQGDKLTRILHSAAYQPQRLKFEN